MSAESLRDTVPWYRSPVFEEFLGSFLGEVTLPYAPESVGAARGFMRCLTGTWGVSHVAEKAELCVSEVVTNAYQHTVSRDGSPLHLIVLRVGTHLRCEVHDPSRNTPRVKTADMLDESGRGMFLLEMVAYEFGVYRTDKGKAVWFELDAWPENGVVRT